VAETFVVCSPREAVTTVSLSSFESWLKQTFPDARVVERGIGAHAIGWMCGDYGASQWMDGWINERCDAFYLEGDLDLICETALELRRLFPSNVDVVLTSDSEAISFDLRKTATGRQLRNAVDRGDETIAWRERASGNPPIAENRRTEG
jgi:hypothetical protein